MEEERYCTFFRHYIEASCSSQREKLILNIIPLT